VQKKNIKAVRLGPRFTTVLAVWKERHQQAQGFFFGCLWRILPNLEQFQAKLAG